MASGMLRASRPVSLVGLAGVRRRVLQHDRGDPGDVFAGDRTETSLPGRPADHAVLAGEHGQEVEVERVPQERVRHPGGPDVLFGVPVVAGEREDGCRRRPEEGRVHDVLDTGAGGGVHEGPVLVEALGALGPRDHEEHVDAGEGRVGGLGVPVGRLDDVGAGDLGSAVG